MNQHICGPGWEIALNNGVASKTYTDVDDLVLLGDLDIGPRYRVRLFLLLSSRKFDTLLH